MAFEQGPDYLVGETKRRLDCAVASLAAVALSPLVMTAAVASAVDTRSVNPFLRQERVGYGGSMFEVLKLRTLRTALTTHTTETYGTFDPRATKLSSRLREYGIDEIPQLANVLNGTMTMVGIRPLLKSDFDSMGNHDPGLFEEWSSAYLSSKPGLTGPGQIYRHNFKASTPEVYAHSMRLDLEYVESASLSRDIGILAITPFKMIEANLSTIENQAH